MFQHSADGFIHWKEEVGYRKLHDLLTSMGDCPPEAIREINDKLGLPYTAEAFAQLECHDKDAAEKIMTLLQKQAKELQLLLEHPRTKNMLTPLTHQEMRRMTRMLVRIRRLSPEPVSYGIGQQSIETEV